MPASHGEMRPSGVTAVASWTTSPAPPRARLPRWTRCQSDGWPSVEEYWHIGETQARLRNVVPRRVRGRKRWLMDTGNPAAPATLPRLPWCPVPCRPADVLLLTSRARLLAVAAAGLSVAAVLSGIPADAQQTGAAVAMTPT